MTIKPKNKDKTTNHHRIGNRIKAKKVRVIGPDGKNLGVLSIQEALIEAENLGLDLVEVGNEEIPTCKILDYGKMKYEQSKKEKKKEKKTHEIQFRPKIAEHDFEVKVIKARKFLESGSGVHFSVQFRGRETMHPEIGSALLDRAYEMLKDVSNLIKKPLLNGRNMDMILAPNGSSKMD
jgi:translation initiation factor IF-3